MRLDYQFNPDQIERFSRYFLYFALFSFVFIISFTRIHNGDIWWALAEGREITTSHSLQNVNRFSYTFPSQPWNSAQWLFSLSAYSIHQLTGVPGLILIKIAVFLFIILLLIKILQPRMPNQFVLILLLLLFILSVHFRIMIRAHLFSILFFTLFLFLVDRYRTGKHRLSLLVTFNNAILVQFPFRISLWFWIARPCCLGRFSSIPVYKTSFFSAITPQTTVSSLYVSCLSLFNYQFYQSAGTLLAGAHDYSLRHWRSYSAC